MVGPHDNFIQLLMLPAAPVVLQLVPAPPEPAGEFAALLYGYYIFLILIVALLSIVAWLLKNNYQQSVRHTKITEQFNSRSASFENTARTISETSNRRLAVVEDRQAQQILTQAMIAKTADAIQTELEEHTERAEGYIEASTARENETLDTVRPLPEKIQALTDAVDLLRKEALLKLDLTHKATLEHIENQFEAARLSMETSFQTMTAVLSKTDAAPDDPQPPPAPDTPPPPTTTPAAAPPPGTPEQEETPDEEPQKKIA